MYDTYQMQEHICKELEKKDQNGLKSTQDLDTVWKLIDAYKNLLKIDMLQEAEEYSHDGGYDNGHSERRRKRDSMGRYSRTDGGTYRYEGEGSYNRGNSYRGGYSEAKGDYMEAKNSYRSTRSAESRRDMNDSMEKFKENLLDELKELMANADTREERDAFKEMFRAVGNLA